MKITQQELLDIIRESINDIDPEDELRETLISLIYDIIKGDPDRLKNKEFYYSGKGKFTEQNLEASKEEIKDYYNNKTKYGWAASASATREELDKLLENVLGVTDTLGKPKYNSKKDALEKMLNVTNLEDFAIMKGAELAKKLNKITESELKKIIKEETEQVLSEFKEYEDYAVDDHIIVRVSPDGYDISVDYAEKGENTELDGSSLFGGPPQLLALAKIVKKFKDDE